MSDHVAHQLPEPLSSLPKIFQDAPIGIVITGLDYKFIRANKCICDWLGYSESELQNRTFAEITHKDDLEASVDVAQKLVDNKILSTNVDKRYVRKDGSIMWASITVTAIKDNDDKPCGFLGFVQNISERVACEREHGQNEELLNQLADNIDEVIWIADAKTQKTLYVSPAYETIWRASRQSLYDNTDSYLSALHPDDRQIMVDGISQAIEKNGGRFTIEYRLQHEDGSIRWLVSRGFPILDRAGNLARLCGITEDITERKEAEAQIARLNQNLQERLLELADANKKLESLTERALVAAKVKSEFVTNISHEIRTPLSAAIGMTELLLDTELNEEQLVLARSMYGSSQALLAIINDLLDFSKLEAGHIKIESVDMNVAAIAAECADMLAAKAREKQLLLTTFIDPQIPKIIKGDPHRLRQVLLNLVDNAVKFTHQGQINIDVKIVARKNDGLTLNFSVKDTGIGLNEEVRHHIFKPFVQADGSTTRKYGGTGLGLSISKRLVELMGGELSCDSTEGVGSRFFFTISYKF